MKDLPAVEHRLLLVAGVDTVNHVWRAAVAAYASSQVRTLLIMRVSLLRRTRGETELISTSIGFCSDLCFAVHKSVHTLGAQAPEPRRKRRRWQQQQ